MIKVFHYGLHYAAGSVGFLVQPGATQSIYEIECPFVMNRNGVICPHRVDVEQRDDRHRRLLEDPLVAWMANPKGVGILQGMEHLKLVEDLAQIYWPTRPLMAPAWGYSSIWRQELNITNFCPWILVDASDRQMDLLHSAAHLPRPILAISTVPLPGTTLTTSLKHLPDQPALRRFGAWLAYERLKRP